MPRFRDTQMGSKPTDFPRVVDPKNVLRTVDEANLKALNLAREKGIETTFDRFVAQQPQCGFGYKGICCRICIAGPCRVKADDGPGSRGICGANAYTIVARNIVRLIAGGASSHSDHGRHIATVLKNVAKGHAKDYQVADPDKLVRIAKRIGLDVEGKDTLTLAGEVAQVALDDYSKHDDEPTVFLSSTITEGRRQKFDETNIYPRAIDREVVSILAGTTMGMDADPVNIIFQGLRTALADYTGMQLSTDLSDVLFGTPKPTVTESNLGTLDPKQVNIAVHGHNPLLSMMVVEAARELKDEAVAAGATGINLVGICCTGNEMLMRAGVKLASNTASQELVLMTGVVDSIVVDVQCIMPSLPTVCNCFHTKMFTTNWIAKIPGAEHLPFNEDTAKEDAKKLVREAIKAFKLRDPQKVVDFGVKNQLVAGFSLEAMYELFGAINSDAPVKVLTDAILAGEIKGVCLFAGCNNLKSFQDMSHLAIVKELAKNDVFLVATGCSAGAFGKAGLLTSAAVDAYAGPGLKAFIKRLEEANTGKLAAGLPLIFHMGACVDNTRAANLCTDMANQLGVDIPKVPFVASAPEAMHEKAVAIGSWAVAMGLPTHVGAMPPIEGSELVYGITTQIASDVFGGYFIFEMDDMEASKKLLAALDYRTWKLGIHHQTVEKFNTSLHQGY